MNRFKSIFSLLLLVMVSFSASVFAGSATAVMTNTATVNGGCTISTSGFSASYDPVSANATLPADANIGVTTTCTTGLTATITLGQGANAGSGSTDAIPVRRLSNGAGGYLTYSIMTDVTHATTWGNTAGTGQTSTGLGVPVTLTGYARIPAGQTSAAAGAYTDTVVATVSF